MGGLRGGRGGGGGGGFEEESDSFDAMDDAKSLSDGCELFLGGGGGGGDESVGCCVVASMLFLWRIAMSYVAPRAAAVRASALCSPETSRESGLRYRALRQSSGPRPLRPNRLSGPRRPWPTLGNFSPC